MFSFVGYRLGCRSRILVIGRGSGSESELSLGHFTPYPYFLFVIYYIVFYRMHGRPFHLIVSHLVGLQACCLELVAALDVNHGASEVCDRPASP